MSNKKEYIVLSVIIVLIAFVGGLVVGHNTVATPRDKGLMSHSGMVAPHAHDRRDVDEPYPTLEVFITPDTKMGWNIELVTTNFRFAPERVNTDFVPGEGHAHIYVNGVRLTRLYGPWYYLKELPAGENLITVSLSGNDHSELYAAGEKVEVSQLIQVDEQ